MEEGGETTEKLRDLEGEAVTALQLPAESLPSAEFVKVEKNLASLGFFTPSSKRLRNAQEKSFTVTTVADGQRLELKGTIIPSAKYGLPITADQDKWIALCKILTDILQREGKVTNPISFTSADILRLLHKHRHSGKNYREIEEWLDVLFSTTIFSEGVVYLAKEKRRVKDRFRVFERAVSFGKELPDGKTADKNYVWFSDWQLQNINSNHLLPIDIDAYRELKNHIAKALVPLLQVWLYATREEGVFEKRYDELCEILNIRRYPYLSLIRRTLSPSLDELKQFGYLADWRIEKTTDKQSYKILLYHGEKFHRDRRARLNRRRSSAEMGSQHGNRHGVNYAGSLQTDHYQTTPPATVSPTFDPQLIAEFTRRGIDEAKARNLIAHRQPGQDFIAQLEHLDQTIEKLALTENRVMNPTGFYIRLIERNTPVPDGFETGAHRRAREERERNDRLERDRAEAQARREEEYDAYREAEIDRYIVANQATFDALKDARWKADQEKYSFATETMAKLAARNEMGKQVPLLTLEEFLDRKRQGTDFSLKPVGVPPPPESETTTPLVDEQAAPTEAVALASTETGPSEMKGVSPKSESGPAAHMGPVMSPADTPAMEPAVPEPMMVELVSEVPPPAEPDPNAAGPGVV